MAKFSEEQIKELKKTKYVVSVNENQVDFTAEFKKIAVEEWSKGMSPTEIFNKYGIDYATIGKRRANSCLNRWRTQKARSEGFKRMKSAGRPKALVFKTPEEEIKYLKDQLEYQKQELEFIKKIDALERKYHRKSQRKKNTR